MMSVVFAWLLRALLMGERSVRHTAPLKDEQAITNILMPCPPCSSRLCSSFAELFPFPFFITPQFWTHDAKIEREACGGQFGGDCEAWMALAHEDLAINLHAAKTMASKSRHINRRNARILVGFRRLGVL